MKIKINIKSTHVPGFDHLGRPRSKQDVVNMISRAHLTTISPHGTYLSMRNDDGMARVYSLEKRRKVVEILAKPKKWTKKQLLANGFEVTDVKYTKRVVKTPAHWVGFYYDIPVAALQMAGLKVIQGSRTFKFVPR